MSSTAVDSHSPPVHVPQPSKSVIDNNDDEKLEESVNHNNKNTQEGKNNSAATKTSVTMTKIDLSGLGNDTAVKGSATDVPAGGKSNAVVQISPDETGVDENRYEIICSFPPDSSVSNLNGRLRFELVTVRENGRLQIFMEPYRWPQLVRSPLRNGRLRMWLMNDDQDGGEQVSPPLQGRQDDRNVD
ncbi:hypothetical protein L1887_02167 [Cichorium endivia]|nr:hypothetical protein L1887_02167 [Cichorium endivia]